MTIENYLRYNEVTRHVLQLLCSDKYDRDEIDQKLRERASLFSEFEQTGWAHADEAEVIIRDTLKLEHECIRVIKTKRKILERELNRLNTKKHAIGRYIAHAT